MKFFVSFFLCLFLTCGGALAASLEESYLAARDNYIETLKRLENVKDGEKAFDAEHKKALADLEKRLRRIVGDLSVKGLPAKGKINLEALTDSGVGFGMLDGLVFSAGDKGPRVVATTESLLERWLAGHAELWEKKQKSPPETDSVLKWDDFYTSAIGSDAAYAKSAELPISNPNGVTFAYATLGLWAQDIGPHPPNEITVTLRGGGTIHIASASLKTKIAKIPACEKIWKESASMAEKLFAAYSAGGSKDDKKFDEYTRTQEKGDADFHACFAERAPREAFFPGVTREAQALADRFAAH